MATQTQKNAKVWTWAVAGMPQQPVTNLQQNPATPNTQNVQYQGDAKVGTGSVAPLNLNQTPTLQWGLNANQGKTVPTFTTNQSTYQTAESVNTWRAGTVTRGIAKASTNGSGLRNADINYSQYGDDSSAPNQAQAWWLNEKYTWEWVKNSQVNYDPNIKTGDLGDMAVGRQGQLANSNQANYLATRNDNIASALYNEGRTSKEDVISYLASLPGWNNSTEADRVNTVEAVRKRLGDIASQQNPEQPQGPVEQQPTPENPQGSDVSITDEQAKNWVIYGRASGNENTRIETNADAFSPDAIQLRQRQANLTTLNSMDSYDIALTLNSWASIFGETAMRDLMTYNPQKYQEIQQYQKQLNGMANVNAIAKGGSVDITAQTTSATDVVNSWLDNWIQQNSTERSYGDVKGIISDAMANSQTATTATQEMLNLNSQMAELQEELDNLPKTAQKQFKGDVPQYIVDAYVSNNSQRIQSELNKLQTRYNAAIDLYKTELSNKQWETEIMLKERQLNSDINYQNWQMANGNAKLNLERSKLNLDAQQQYWNQGYLERKLNYDSIVEINGKSYIPNWQGGFEELSSTIAYQSYQNTVGEKMQSYMNMFPDGADGWQCEQFTDAFTYSTTWLKMEWANGRAYTTAEEKAWYVNSWVPEVGSVAVFDYWIVQDDGNNYGHTMLVEAYDPATGIITLKGSNKSRKPEEFEKVYSQTMSLSDLNNKGAFLWFWNPYLDKVESSYDGSVIGGTGAGNSLFPRTITPMATMIDTLKGNASTAGQLTQIAVGEQMYNTMYELQQGWYLDKLIQSGVVEDFINALDRKKFGKQWDERGSEFLNQMWKFLRNEIKDEEVSYAMNRLYQLVEQKLREESGAAISSSEWAMDFQLFLPQPWMSETLRRKQLEAWDDIIYKQLSGAGMKSSDYIPIFDYNNYSTGMSSWRAIW